MSNATRKTFQYGAHTVTLETGEIARQAGGAVLVNMDDTVVLCTVVAAKKPKPGQSFFPLTVDYVEKFYAAGRIPGGFFKREGRPTEKDTLTSRLIDRPIRPLFPEGLYNEVQVVATVLSVNPEVDGDIPAMIGVSAALIISGVPCNWPIGGARVGYIDGQYVLNPTASQLKESKLNLVVAGTEHAVLMVESEAEELSEDAMLGAVVFGHEQMQTAIRAINELADEAGKPAWDWQPPAQDQSLVARITELADADLRDAYGIKQKQARSVRLDEIRKRVEAAVLVGDDAPDSNVVGDILFGMEAKIVRSQILDGEPRIDGRDTRTVRPISIKVGVLPRTHGSALFTRGETQALVIATLGTGRDEQIIDAITGEYRERFMLHYNMPPYATGETGRMGAPKRREIGHGRLAKRALAAVLPTAEEFGYSIRVVSEITESNGSSSMASVCGGSLALMDAGVPTKAQVAGIAMGLIKEGNRFAVLSDILGDEDHLGDMDFKVAGTQGGVTALQMDIKITSITEEIMKIALGQAKDGRLHILGEMAKGLGGARESVSQNAPRITQFTIPKDKIREVIGTGGKVIREITETTGTKIDIEDDGTIKVAAVDSKAGQAAIDWIKGIVAEPEVGVIYSGKVVKTVEFGAFVNFLGARDGLVHISELAPRRVAKVSDVVKEGDQVKVKVLGVDDRGKVRLSMKAVDQQTGEDISQKPLEEAAEASAAGE